MIMPSFEPIAILTRGKPILRQIWMLLTAVRTFQINKNWFFTLPNGTEIVIPKGFVFDGASIPKPLWFLCGLIVLAIFLGVTISYEILLIFSCLFLIAGVTLSPVGLLLIAGLVHDFAYRYGYLWKVNKDGSYSKYTHRNGDRLDYDELFLDINLQVNGMVFTDYLASGLLAIFGKIAWVKNRDLNAPELHPSDSEIDTII